MTVKDIVDQLKECDQDANVFMILNDDNPLNCADRISNVFEIKGSTQSDYNGVYLQSN